MTFGWEKKSKKKKKKLDSLESLLGKYCKI